MIGLRWSNRFLCVPPLANNPRGEVFSDHMDLDRCGEVIVKDEGEGWISVLFDEAQWQLAIEPDGRFTTRAKGAVGLYEKFRLAADRQSCARVGVTLEIVGTLAPPVSAIHLEQRGNDFVDAAGQRIVFCGIDGFDDLWFRTQGREAELDALLKESQALKAKVRRIWCMGDAGENQVFSLYPQNVSQYSDQLRSLVAYENGFGVIPLFTVFVDAQRVMPTQADRQRFWVQLCEALAGSGAYLLSGGNQYPKNGFDPWADLASPAGVIWSRGSSTDDLQTAPRGAPASELHATRNAWPRALMDTTASPPFMRSDGGSTMVWMTEGNPFGDGGAYTAPQAWQLGRGYSIDWALAIYHNRQSQRGQLMQDATARTFEAFEQGMRL